MSSREQCKVERVVERHGVGPRSDPFDDVDEELLALWKGRTNRDPLGYRSLAEWFNKQLLRTVYETNGRLTMGTRLDTEFETLTGDDDIARGELLDELAQDGIDGQQLCDDMISFSTLRRHLTDCLDGEKERRRAETDWEQKSIDIATEQLVEKVEKALSSFENKERLAGGTAADVSVQIQLSCPHCPTRRPMSEAIRLGYVCEDHLGTADN